MQKKPTTAKAVKKTKQKPTKKTEKVKPQKPTKKVSGFVATEKEDDKLIVGSLKGQLLPFFAYQYCEQGCESKENCPHDLITIPTVKGTSEVAHRLNKKKQDYKIRIRQDLQKIENNVSQGGVLGVQATVIAENIADGTITTGAKFEAYKDAKGRRNDFALEKALSKAERNAYRKLISEIDFMEEFEALIEKYPKSIKFINKPEEIEEETVAVEPKTTNEEEKTHIIIRAIRQTKSVEQVETIKEKTKQGTLKKKYISEILKIADQRISEINTANQEVRYEDV